MNDNPSPTSIAFTRDDFIRCAQALAAIIRYTDDEELTPEIKTVRFEANETLSKIIHMIQVVDQVIASREDDTDDNYKSQLN